MEIFMPHKCDKIIAVAGFCGLNAHGISMKTVVGIFQQRGINVPEGTHTWEQFFQLLPHWSTSLARSPTLARESGSNLKY